MDYIELSQRAESGSCAAQTTLGLLYLYGDDSVGIDYEKAYDLLSRAAEQGASRAIANLGDMYLNGLGTAKDVDKAILLYQRVAKVEFFAALELGRIYAKGTAVPADPQKAREWYSIAVSFGGPDFDYDSVGDELNEAKTYLKRYSGTQEDLA